MLFLSDTESKTLDEYLALFRRCICMDLVLAAVYAAIAFEAGMQIPSYGHAAGFLDEVMFAVAALVVLFWIADACLVAHFKNIVETSRGRAETMAKVIKWKRLCVANASIGLILYGTRLAVEAYQFWKEGVFANMLYPLAFGFLLILKTMRVLAFNSFSKWLRLYWESSGE